jgi:hypothetical protein
MSLVRRLRGVAHVRLDDIGSSSFQRVGVEVERSVRQHNSGVMILAKNRQGYARTVLTKIVGNPRVPTGITDGGTRRRRRGDGSVVAAVARVV